MVRAPDRRLDTVAAVVLVIVAAAFLVSAWPRIMAPFGDSDEGINGAVWGYDSRSLRELGPVEARLGGVRIDGTKYATHPPLIVVETALVERVVGEHPWSTRAPAWVGALATIPLLFLLLRALALSVVAAAAATAAALACHFFFVYGSMLDTMIIALPFAVALCLVWYRQWTGDHRFHPVAVAALALATGLAGWQGIFLVGLAGVAIAARARTRQWRAAADALPYLVPAVLSAALTVAWGYWVYGSFAILHDKLVRRTGGEDTSVAGMITFQVPWLSQLLGLGFLAWVATAVSLRDRRFRPLAALTLSSVILYALILREGSGGHQYWNAWGLLPAAVGFAYVFDGLQQAATRARLSGGACAAILLAVTGVIAVANAAQPNRAAELIDRGVDVYGLVERTSLPRDQKDLPYVAEPYRLDDWLRYRGGPRGRPIQSAEELRILARDHPDHLVMVAGACAAPDPTGICDRLTFGPVADHAESVPARFVTAADLASRLP